MPAALREGGGSATPCFTRGCDLARTGEVLARVAGEHHETARRNSLANRPKTAIREARWLGVSTTHHFAGSVRFYDALSMRAIMHGRRGRSCARTRRCSVALGYGRLGAGARGIWPWHGDEDALGRRRHARCRRAPWLSGASTAPNDRDHHRAPAQRGRASPCQRARRRVKSARSCPDHSSPDGTPADDRSHRRPAAGGSAEVARRLDVRAHRAIPPRARCFTIAGSSAGFSPRQSARRGGASTVRASRASANGSVTSSTKIRALTAAAV